jgi:hypothetical protein
MRREQEEVCGWGFVVLSYNAHRRKRKAVAGFVGMCLGTDNEI